MNVLPLPAESHLDGENTYVMGRPVIKIMLGQFAPAAVETFLDRTGLRAEYAATGTEQGLVLQLEQTFAPEEYELTVAAQGVWVKAATNQAAILALATLYQLMSETGEVPFCNIHDLPRYAHRGLSLDCARHFFSVEEVKRILEQMSLVKMNVLHWHLTDDQAWRIESKRYPRLHQQHGTGFFSQEEIRQVVAHAAARGIEVIPEIEMPGHVSALLAAYPQYSCSGKQVRPATSGGIYPIILCAGNENTYTLLSDLLDEICPLFPSTRFHIGGDEAPKKEWKKCPCCQQKIKEKGLANEIELQGYFSNRIISMLRKKGKTAICWNESLDAKQFDTSAQIQFWTVNGAEQASAFAKKGGKLIYSDMFTYYFDYPYSMTPLKRLYEDIPAIGELTLATDPAVLGREVCMWAEHIIERKKLEEHLFPRLYAASEIMWTDAVQCNYAEFQSRLHVFLSKHHPTDMGLVPESGWNPQGDARRNEALSYMASITGSMSDEVRAETTESAAPSEFFTRKFMTCFFEPSDLPYLRP